MLLDVIDDPEEKWLSLCFYGDTITDPDDLGNLIPDGLQGEDGYCFDVESPDEDALSYMKARLDEAYDKGLG